MKIIINERFEATQDFTVLGIIGENNARTISVVQPKLVEADSYKLRFAYPDGVVYDVPIEDDKLIVTASLLRCNDEIQCQWIATRTDGENVTLVAKSQIFYLRVLPSLSDETEPVPSPEISVDALEQIMTIKDQTIAAKNQAELAAEAAVQEVSDINNLINCDLLSGITINNNTDIPDEEPEGAPFDDENYDYVDVTKTVSGGNVLSDVIELLNGTYRFTADKKSNFYVYLYDPYDGYYVYIETINSSSWETSGDKFICNIEIETEYEHNYVRVGYHTTMSSWNKYGLTLKRLPTKILTNYEYDKLSGGIADNKSSLQTLSARVDQNTADIASIRSDASDVIIANPKITDFMSARLNIGPSHIVTFENGKLRQKYISSTGNGFWIMDITPGASESDVLRVKVVVDEILRGQIVVSAVGDSASNNNTIWTTLGRISEAGEYSYDINLDYLSSAKDVDLSKNIRIVFANATASSATIPLEDNQLESVYSYAAVYDAVNSLDGSMTDIINNLNRRITALEANG